MPANKQISFEGVHRFLKSLFAGDLHAKRILSLAGATTGAIEASSLAVALIGQGLALARGLLPKHAIKQIDRLLSNEGIDVDALFVHWVPYVLGKRPSVTVAMDWTDFDDDDQATIMLSLITRHGRATPLVWLTVDKATLKNRRNCYEDQVLTRLAEVVPTKFSRIAEQVVRHQGGVRLRAGAAVRRGRRLRLRPDPRRGRASGVQPGQSDHPPAVRAPHAPDVLRPEAAGVAGRGESDHRAARTSSRLARLSVSRATAPACLVSP